MGHLNDKARTILSCAISNRTKKIYFHYWKQYVTFCRETDVPFSFPVSEACLLNFLAHLMFKGYKVGTVASHASALAYIHKLFGHADFSGSFFLKQFLKGANNFSVDNNQPDSRLPITFSLLSKIILSLPKVIINTYERVLFATMCILAFQGFLRIGEICVKSSAEDNVKTVLQYHDVQVRQIEDKTGVEVRLQKFKHGKHPVMLFLPENTDQCICPVAITKLYLAQAPNRGGPFFQHLNKSPVTYQVFSSYLKSVITFLGLDSTRYKSHSFRIGAATHAAAKGFSEEAIKRMGRWRSNALQNYIRMPVVSL